MAVAGLGALFTRAEVISWRWKENRRDQAKCGKVCFAPTVTVSNRGTTCPDGHKRTSIRCPPLPPCPRSRLTRTSSHVRFAGATTNGVVVGPISSPGCVSSTARLSCNPFLGHGSTLTSRISSGRSFRRSKYDGLRRGFRNSHSPLTSQHKLHGEDGLLRWTRHHPIPNQIGPRCRYDASKASQFVVHRDFLTPCPSSEKQEVAARCL